MTTRSDDQITIILKRSSREIAKMQIALEEIAAAAGSGLIANLARAGLVLPPHDEAWSRILGHLGHLNACLNRIANLDDGGDMVARHCIAVARRERFSEGDLAA